MAIVRAKRPNPTSTDIENSTLQDARLSWVDLGLLCYLLSLPDDQRISIEYLAMIKKAGKHVVRNALANLEACGYARKVQRHNSGGKFSGVDWYIYDQPYTVVEKLLANCEQTVDMFLPPESENRTTAPMSKNQTPVKSEETCGFQPESDFPMSENRTHINNKNININNRPQDKTAGLATTVTDDFEPDAVTRQRCKQAQCPEITTDHVANFVAHYQASGFTQANWQAKFVQWMLNAKAREKTQTHQTAGKAKAGKWRLTDAEADRLGKALKLPANPGESYQDFKTRLLANADQEQIAQVLN